VYESRYGLRERPFGETTLARAYVPLPSRDAALRRLRYGLEYGQGPALLLGAPGVGKSLVAGRLAADMGAAAVHLTYPAMPAVDLLVHLAAEFAGEPTGPPSAASALRRLREALGGLVADGRRPLLVVDEAQLLLEDSFEVLRLLLNFQVDGAPALALAIVGSDDVAWRLPPALLDRLAARCSLPALTLSESVAYVAGRLAAAGASGPLFSPEALGALHLAALGVPRRLNHVADLALLIAFAEGAPTVDARAVGLAAREFQGDGLAA
jgi:type II secretory pathway predicted ATPase ExeA